MRLPGAGGSPLAAALVVAAIVAATVFRVGDGALAAAGMVILGLLLWAGAPPGLSGRATVRWARRQVPALSAGAVAAGVVLAALTFRPPVAVWTVLAGVAAVVAAYLVAVPRGRRNSQD